MQLRMLMFLLFLLVSLTSLTAQESSVEKMLLALEAIWSEIKSTDAMDLSFDSKVITDCIMQSSDKGCESSIDFYWKDIIYVQRKQLKSEVNSKVFYEPSIVLHFPKGTYDGYVCAMRLREGASEEKIQSFIKGIIKFSKLNGGNPSIVNDSVFD